MNHPVSIREQLIAGLLVNATLIFFLKGLQEGIDSFFFFLILVVTAAVGVFCLNTLYVFKSRTTDVFITLLIVGTVYLWQVVPIGWEFEKITLVISTLFILGALILIVKKWNNET